MHVKQSVSIHSSHGMVRAELDALDLSDINAAILACSRGSDNFRAMELCSKLVDARTRSATTAVYVIAPVGLPVAKIGIAKNPLLRLCGVQIGNWNELSVAALVWTEVAAEKIEQLALRAAKEMGLRLRGEWISADASQACELVLKAARYVGRPVYDSSAWLTNWGARLEAVAELSGNEKRMMAARRKVLDNMRTKE